ncbi:hypothetical protein DFH29DRAFT_876207 [Suillus ampliporus]|nr:hypothetical protein DFH29DRAFT_876207 [Suillus ampliporus]
MGNSDVSLPPVKRDGTSGVNQEIDEEDFIANLKEKLEHAESDCSRLEELYQKYRLCWLEEYHQARVLEEYAPYGINACSVHQIPILDVVQLGADSKSVCPHQLVKVKADLKPPSPSDPLFKLLVLTAAVLIEFFNFNMLFGSTEGGFLTLLSLKNRWWI